MITLTPQQLDRMNALRRMVPDGHKIEISQAANDTLAVSIDGRFAGWVPVEPAESHDQA